MCWFGAHEIFIIIIIIINKFKIKTAVLPKISVEKVFFLLLWRGSLKNCIHLKIEIFCNIVNVFTVIFFNQFNASLLNKMIISLKKKSYWCQNFSVCCLCDFWLATVYWLLCLFFKWSILLILSIWDLMTKPIELQYVNCPTIICAMDMNLSSKCVAFLRSVLLFRWSDLR